MDTTILTLSPLLTLNIGLKNITVSVLVPSLIVFLDICIAVSHIEISFFLYDLGPGWVGDMSGYGYNLCFAEETPRRGPKL